MTVVGLGYKARNGKNTFAKFLNEELGDKYKVGEYSFGAELKQEVNEVYLQHGSSSWPKTFGYIHRNLQELPAWVSVLHTPDMTDPLCPYGKQRSLLQWWGTEYRREQNPNYWINKLYSKLRKEDVDIALITDMRFPNEFSWVQSFGYDGITVKVTRKNFQGIGGNHPSEVSLDGYEFDVNIEAGSLEELRKDAKGFAEFVVERYQLNTLPNFM